MRRQGSGRRVVSCFDQARTCQSGPQKRKGKHADEAPGTRRTMVEATGLCPVGAGLALPAVPVLSCLCSHFVPRSGSALAPSARHAGPCRNGT